MKKLAVSLVAALSVVIMCFALAACSTKFEGTYKFYSMEGKEAGIEINYKVGDDIMGIGKITEDFMVLTVNTDNTLTISTMGQEISGTWKEEGGKYSITVSGTTQEVKVSGNKITFEQNGSKVTLKK